MSKSSEFVAVRSNIPTSMFARIMQRAGGMSETGRRFVVS